jgi:hypothetical protein
VEAFVASNKNTRSNFNGGGGCDHTVFTSSVFLLPRPTLQAREDVVGHIVPKVAPHQLSNGAQRMFACDVSLCVIIVQIMPPVCRESLTIGIGKV